MKRNIAKTISLVFTFIMASSGLIYAKEPDHTSSDVQIIIVNNDSLDMGNNRLSFIFLKSDVSAYIVDGTTMIPLRALGEGFGYKVTYQEENREILIRDTGKESYLIFKVDSTTVLQNDKKDTLLHAPVLNNDRTFIPLRYVSEFFGKHVTWKTSLDEKTIYIWISSVQLLTEEDVAAEEDDANYIVSTYSALGYPLYELKNNGQTYRGVRIGDNYGKIVELYGEPHEKTFLKNGMLSYVSYRTEGLPGTDSGSNIRFSFTNEFVDYITVDGRW